MPDLVGTCPKDFWEEWIAEGDAASEKAGVVYPSVTNEDWHWYTRDPKAPSVQPGERFYVVAHGRLRGWAPVLRVERTVDGWGIVRRGGAVACTVIFPIPGFRGLRVRWWKREEEIPFENWRVP